MAFEGTQRFEIRRRLGAGGMGIVYEAFDRDRKTLVALKTLKRLDADSLLRFKREFRAVQGLEHPNLVSLGELVAHDGAWFFTMELIEGIDFLRYVRAARDQRQRFGTEPTVDLVGGARGVEFDEERLRGALAQLAAGVATLHRAGKVHRDIKPSNVKVTANGQLVLLDFGLATTIDESAQSQAPHAVGTAAYMAPEQAAKRTVGPAADWYSVGVMLYQALTGKLPFIGTSYQILLDKQKGEPEPPSKRAIGVPEDLDDLCVRLLRFRPDDRPGEEEILRCLGADRPGPAHSASQFSAPTLLVGRERELDRIASAFEASESRAATVVMHGESGVGKSALLSHFAELAAVERGDVVTLAGRCYARESIPFKALDGVVDALAAYLGERSLADAAALLPRGAALLPRMFPVLGRVEAIAQAPRLRRPIRDNLELQRRTFVALRELLHRLTDHRRVIVIIDDMQWADADSLLLLADLLRPPHPPPLLLLMSTRSIDFLGEGGTSSPFGGHFEIIQLGPLADDDAELLASKTLARAGLRGQIDPTLIAAEARGNPFYIDELVRHAAISALPEAPSTPRVEAIVWSRAQHLPAKARELLELVAVAGAPMSTQALAVAARMTGGDLLRPLSLLQAANMVRGMGASTGEAIEPFHDRVREAVLAHLDSKRRVQRHARVSIGLEAAGARPELLLRHLEAAGELEKAAMYAEQAAARAEQALAFERAAGFYDTALRLGEQSEVDRRRLSIALSEALANTGRGAESAAAALAAAHGADRTTRLECKRRAAEQLLICGHIEPGLAALRDVLGEVGIGMPSTPWRALLSLASTRLMLRLRGLRWKEKHATEIAQSDLLRVDIYQAASHGLSMVDNVRGADFQARGLRQALHLGEPDRIARAFGMEAIYRASQGPRHFASARQLASRIGELAERSGNEYLRALDGSVHGVLAYFRGDFREAAGILTRAIEVYREETTGAMWELNNTRLFHLFSLRHLGAFERINELFEVYMRDAKRRGDLYLETSLCFYATSALLAGDQPQRATESWSRARWVPLEGRFHLQHWYELEARGEWSLYQGRAAQALDELRERFEGLASSLLLRIQVVRALSRFLEARLLIASVAGGAPDREARLRRAGRLAGKMEREGITFIRVWASLARAGVAHQRGDDAGAVTALRRAEKLAADREMRFHHAVARYRLGDLLGGAEGQEHRAAALAWMTGQKIGNPPRMAEIALPGFSR